MILVACQCSQRSRVLNGVDGRAVVTLDAVHAADVFAQEHTLDSTAWKRTEANGTFDRQELRDDGFVIIPIREKNIFQVGYVQILEHVHRHGAQGACDTFDFHRRLWNEDTGQFAEQQSVHFLTRQRERMVDRMDENLTENSSSM